jgi:hypothetical protein
VCVCLFVFVFVFVFVCVVCVCVCVLVYMWLACARVCLPLCSYLLQSWLHRPEKFSHFLGEHSLLPQTTSQICVEVQDGKYPREDDRIVDCRRLCGRALLLPPDNNANIDVLESVFGEKLSPAAKVSREKGAMARSADDHEAGVRMDEDKTDGRGDNEEDDEEDGDKGEDQDEDDEEQDNEEDLENEVFDVEDADTDEDGEEAAGEGEEEEAREAGRAGEAGEDEEEGQGDAKEAAAGEGEDEQIEEGEEAGAKATTPRRSQRKGAKTNLDGGGPKYYVVVPFHPFLSDRVSERSSNQEKTKEKRS